MTNNFNNLDQHAMMQKLQAPFPLNDIEFRVGSTNQDKSRGKALAYLTSRAIQARLDEVFGIGGWKSKFEPWKDKGVLCTISVKVDGEWVSKQDAGEDTDFEEIKGGISSALKRCAVHFGIGRYLYRLEPQWLAIKPSGKSHVFVEKPTLPDWALPSEESKQQYLSEASLQFQVSRTDAPNNKDMNVQTEISCEEKCVCAVCGKRNVTPKAKKYSVERWGTSICFNCQQERPENKKVSGNPAPVSARQHEETAKYRQPFDDEVPF